MLFDAVADRLFAQGQGRLIKKRAYFFLVSGCILGFAMGWAQMMRGAHFLSHNLWTAWVIWLVNVVFYFFNYKHFTTTHSSQE